VFDSQGFSRLVKATTNGASGNVADGFYGGDVTLTVTLNDNVPFSFDCATHTYEGANNAFVYNGTCTECAQPNMYVRLNMDPATLPAPPAWPSNVPEVQVRFKNDGDFYFGPPGGFGNGIARGKLDFPSISGVISGLVLKLYGVTASQGITDAVILLRSPTGKDVLIAGRLPVPENSVGVDYTINNDLNSPLLSFGTSGSFRPNPNGNQDGNFWNDSSSPYGTTFSDLFNDSPTGEWTLGLVANTVGGPYEVKIKSWSLEVLTSTNESHTVWSISRQDAGKTAIAAFPYQPDTVVQNGLVDGFTTYPTSLGANSVSYFRFRSQYTANYYLNAGGFNTGGIRLDIYRNWDASGSPDTTYTNLFDSQQKRLSCTSGEFITFKFTNTVDSSKQIRLKLQTPGVHYEISADEQNWFMPNRWKWGGSSATAAATYNLNLKRLTNSKFAIRLLEGTVTTSFTAMPGGGGVGQVTSESNTFYYYDSTKSETQELVFTMGGSSPTTRHMETLTGVLHTENDANDPERQAIKYDSACRGGTPPEDTTPPPTTTGQPWVAGYYCVSDSYQGTTSCSYISSRPASNPLVTYSGPYASSLACNATCVTTTTTTTTTANPNTTTTTTTANPNTTTTTTTADPNTTTTTTTADPNTTTTTTTSDPNTTTTTTTSTTTTTTTEQPTVKMCWTYRNDVDSNDYRTLCQPLDQQAPNTITIGIATYTNIGANAAYNVNDCADCFANPDGTTTTSTTTTTTTSTTTAAPTTTTTTTTTSAPRLWCATYYYNGSHDYIARCYDYDSAWYGSQFLYPTISYNTHTYQVVNGREITDCANCSPDTSTSTTSTTTTTTPAPTTQSPTTATPTQSPTTSSPTTTGAGTTGDPTITTQPGTTSAPSYRYNCVPTAQSGSGIYYDCQSTGSTTNGTYATLQDCLNAGCQGWR
jgi:hypothetical protein